MVGRSLWKKKPIGATTKTAALRLFNNSITWVYQNYLLLMQIYVLPMYCQLPLILPYFLKIECWFIGVFCWFEGVFGSKLPLCKCGTLPIELIALKWRAIILFNFVLVILIIQVLLIIIYAQYYVLVEFLILCIVVGIAVYAVVVDLFSEEGRRHQKENCLFLLGCLGFFIIGWIVIVILPLLPFFLS